MRRKRIYFFNRFFWPDNSATAQILTDLVRGLDGEPLEVVVVTSRLNYGDSSIQYPSSEVFGQATVHRLWSTRFGRKSTSGRLLDYLTIYLTFFLYSLRHLQAGDVAVYKTDPPLLSVPGALAKLLKRFKMVCWCQDLFPEVAISEIQMPTGTRWVMRVIATVRDWSLKQSEGVVVLGRDMRDYLRERGIPSTKLVAISNWSVQEESPDAAKANLRKEWGNSSDTFVVGYSGNLGRAHDWQTVLDAAAKLAHEPDLVFLCCGGGYGYERLQEAAGARGLENLFRFLPYQPLELLSASLDVPDVHWFTLKERLTPFIFPSKFFGILQAAKPLVFIGDTGCEIAEIIRENRMGTAVSEGDSAAFAKAVLACKREPSLRGAAGQRSRKVWEDHYQKVREITKWKKLVHALFTNDH